MLEILIGVYIVIALFFAGLLVGDEMNFANPNYGWVLASAALWPMGLFRVAYHQFWRKQ